MSTFDKIALLKDILKESENSVRDAAFYKRILVQAMLTANGELSVDPKFAEEASSFNGNLEFGNGKVCIHGGKGSLFNEL